MPTTTKTLVSDGLGLGADNLGGYFNNLFELALVIGAILAVLIIATAGLQYMTSEAIPAKTSSKERITQALLGLLMLLAVWLFFKEINPNILNLNFTLQPVQVTGGNLDGTPASDAGSGRQQTDAERRAARNPLFPGSTIGTSYLTPTWTTIPFNQSCRDVKGEGWVTIDDHHCAGSSPSSQSRCCGKDPSHTPTSRFKVGDQVRINDPGVPSQNLADGPFHGQTGVVERVIFTSNGDPRYIVRFPDGQTSNFGHRLVESPSSGRWCLWDANRTSVCFDSSSQIPPNSWCYGIDDGGSNCFATENECNENADVDSKNTSSCEQI